MTVPERNEEEETFLTMSWIGISGAFLTGKSAIFIRIKSSGAPPARPPQSSVIVDTPKNEMSSRATF